MPTKPSTIPLNERDWLTLAEVRELFGIHRNTMRRLIKDGVIPAGCWTRIGDRGVYRVKRSALDAHMQSTGRIAA